MERDEFFKMVDDLISAWCERKALAPLRILLPAWPIGMGLTDNWQDLRDALRHVRAMTKESLPVSEQQKLNELIATVDQVLFRD